MIVSLLAGVYISVIAGIALFGMLGLVTIWFFWKHRKADYPLPKIPEDQLPRVTVQLPLFNERLVVKRLIESAVQLDYPSDRLHIQVLDDSNDETCVIAAESVSNYQIAGCDIELLSRHERIGFKAGALEVGLRSAKGQFVVIFDADFIPEPDFLRKTIPYFVNEPELGMIQARWGHINGEESALTAAQTIALDKHFVMEQSVRHRANLFPKFNGSAGIWRRSCLEDAGGWQDDTVCEDLCLSTRAVLRGWKFRYLNGVVAPAELPRTISAYKNQQSRWAKGSTQCLVKFGPSILTARRHSMVARLYALVSMAGYATHLLLLVLLLVQVPLIYLGYKPPALLILFGIASISQPLLFIFGQRYLYQDWLSRLRYIPALLIVAIGLAPSNSRAILEAVTGRRNNFIRTPKGDSTHGDGKQSPLAAYKLPIDWIVIIEALLAFYAIVGLIVSIERANYWPMLFMTACVLGFGYVALASIRESW